MLDKIFLGFPNSDVNVHYMKKKLGDAIEKLLKKQK